MRLAMSAVCLRGLDRPESMQAEPRIEFEERVSEMVSVRMAEWK